MKYRSLFIVILFLALPNVAFADQPLTFKKPNGFKALEIISHIKNQVDSDIDMDIATIDLNDDFIDEYIVRNNKCDTENFCTFSIVAYMNRIPIILGQFDAHKIIILDKKDYGIRRIVVYNQKNNDFATATAIWHPNTYQYDFSK